MMRKTLLLLALLLAALPLKAQFYMAGDDPGHLRWFTIQTPHYQLIYPEGADSLARTYGRLLEQFRVPVGRSYGFIPGEGQSRKMPVVLHAYNPYSNGSVGWAPQRFDLYTQPDAYNTIPSPWPIQLASHEPRHQAQLQKPGIRFLRRLTGDAWNPIAYQIFVGHALGEGDAVTVETGFGLGTRARTADFLNFYRVALDQGEHRSWFRWRYGSYRRITPDHYALGYLTVAGSRYLTGDPLIMKETAENARRRPYLLSANFRHSLKEKRQGVRFNETFCEILDSVNAHWQANTAARAPFLEMERITPRESFPVNYSSVQAGPDGTLYALRSGPVRTPELIAIRGGKTVRIRHFQSTETSLYLDPVRNRLYWTEKRQDPRWKLGGSSVVVYYDLNTDKTKDLAAGHYYYNARPSKDGKQLVAAEYLPSGENCVVFLCADNGQQLRRIRVPDGIQPTEFGWWGEEVFLAGISAQGAGIYRIGANGDWEQVLQPSIQKVVKMGSGENFVDWVSDRTGVNEYYRYYPGEGRLLQMTSTRYGATDPSYDGEYLYCASQTLEGMLLFRTPLQALQPREVTFTDTHTYFLADTIASQEQALGASVQLESAVPMSRPVRYRKILHPLRLHTWLPLYVNYDAVTEGSMDLSYKTAALGLSGYFQNTLGTVSGMVGYSLHPSPDNANNWRNAVHAKLLYTGLYPVFEASFDLGDRSARQYLVKRYDNGNSMRQTTTFQTMSGPLFEASLRAYVPLSVRRHGVNYGFVPQLKYTLSNNWMATEPVLLSAPERYFKGLSTYYLLKSFGGGGNVPMQRLSVSVRGYAMLSKASRQVYPRLGIGAEAGVNLRPGQTALFTPNIYGYCYGYLPGLFRPQGLKLTGIVQQQIRPQGLVFGELAVQTLPRGFDSAAGSLLAQEHPLQWKVTADYAIPFSFGDISIPGVAYITHFVLTPHGDFTSLGASNNLWSLGADLTAELSKLILPYSSSLGLSFSYLGGSWYPSTQQERPWSLSLIYNMDF